MYNKYKIPCFAVENTSTTPGKDKSGNVIPSTRGLPACFCYINSFTKAFGKDNIKIEINRYGYNKVIGKNSDTSIYDAAQTNM